MAIGNAALITLAGQNITEYVQAESVQFDSVLGSGPGVPTGGGRSATCQMDVRLGPANSAYGAGEALPVSYTNLLSLAQANLQDPTVESTYHFTCTLDATMPYGGNPALKCVSAGTNTYEYLYEQVSPLLLTAGQTYTWSIWVYASGSPNLRFYIQSSAGSISTVATIIPAAAWTRYTVTFQVPTPWTETNVGLRFDTGGTAQAATVWLAEGQLEAGNTAHAWVPGGSTGGSATPVLVRQGELVIIDNAGNTVFGGYVTKLDDITERTAVKTTLYGVDFWQGLDRIMVNVVYNGASDVSIISGLMASYAPGVNTSLANLTSANYVFPKLFLRAKTLQEALKKVAQTTGFDIWVDANNYLRYEAPTDEGTAPFAISDNPDGVTSFPAQFTKVEVDDNAIINRVTFYGGKTPIASDYTQDISNQANGNNTTFVLAYYPHESSNGKVQVTVNGVQQVVGYVFSSGAANTLKSQGGTADLLLNRDAQALQFDVAPASGAAVKCIYRYYTPLMVQITSPASYAFYGNYYDGKISDETVFDISTAILRCRTLLAQQEYGLVTIEFTLLNRPGLVAGTQVRIDNSVRGIHNTYVIQEVRAQGLGGGAYSYDVTVGAWSWQLADLLLANARSQAAEDLQSEAETTIIQVESASVTIHTDFAVTTATRTTGGYYPRSSPLGDGHDAYCGLSTI